MQSCRRSLHPIATEPQPNALIAPFKSLNPSKVAATAGQRTWPAPQQQQQLQLTRACCPYQPNSTNRRAGTTAGSLGRRAMLGGTVLAILTGTKLPEAMLAYCIGLYAYFEKIVENRLGFEYKYINAENPILVHATCTEPGHTVANYAHSCPAVCS